MPDDGPQRSYTSPLRYPGGKGKLANFMRLLFIHNGLAGHEYLELYAGGASVGLSLLFEEYASHIHINDINRGIHAFWDAALNNTEALCRLVSDTPVTMDVWTRQATVQRATEPEPLDLAFSTFFLNRTNRSGIISGGVIGGKRQAGDWKLDARYNKPALIARIQKVGRYRSRITLTNFDAAEYLRDTLPTLLHNTFGYFDPPYYEKGEDLYQHFYGPDDHAQIAGLIRDIDRPWVVSYDAVPEVLALYDGFDKLEYGISYSAQERYRGAEVMFFSRGIEPPPVESPANIYATVVDRARRAALQASLAPA